MFNIFVWGWADVAPGACVTLNGASGDMNYDGKPTNIWYVYARSGSGHWGPGHGDHAVQDFNGVTWDPVKNFCEPGATTPSVDDLQKACSRLPYSIVNNFNGTDYQVDFLP